MTIATAPMPVIVGAPRSGTTLLRLMLDAHPAVAIPPETGFLAVASQWHGEGEDLRRRFFHAVTAFPPDAPAWNDFGIPLATFRAQLQAIEPFSIDAGTRAFYQLYAGRFQKSRWGDKTPTYCLHLDTIARVLPEARIIHLIRDGRDVALSLRQTWFSPGHGIADQAAYWQRCVTAARRFGARSDRYLEVRFEDLVRHSATVLHTMCEFLQLSYSEQMLDYHHRAPARLEEHGDRWRPDGSLLVSREHRRQQQALTMQPPQISRIGDWPHRLSHEERERFDAVAGGLLRELGYG